ncbi:protein HID1-like [Styela clava]
MGNADTKLNFRKAVIQLTTKTQPVEATDDAFWDQFWSESVSNIQDVFALVPAAEIRALREESPSNLATLCYKAVEKLVHASEDGCNTEKEQQVVLNCSRLLTRLLPYIFEDPDWRGFFWSRLPTQQHADDNGAENTVPLAQSLILAVANLLFCPDFTVITHKKKGNPDRPEDLQSIDSCEYIWEEGVGFPHSPPTNGFIDKNRSELLKLLLTCFSESMYVIPSAEKLKNNPWIQCFCSSENRHALPLFTSLLNLVCSYDPVGYGVPYNHLLFKDHREPLVEIACQILIVTLDHGTAVVDEQVMSMTEEDPNATPHASPTHADSDNLFVNYLSRIHRDEDFGLILRGVSRLLNNPLQQTYLPGSAKRIGFHQELLVFFWKLCDINKKFLFYVLKSSDVLDILVPVLYHLNDARTDQSRVGLMHIGVFILLLLSGERNFGVRLNKPFSAGAPTDVPAFAGTHADFLILVFHRIITAGHQRLQPLYDCLLTIIVNVSPYLKSLSMVASTKLLHLLEAFGTPWFLFSSPHNHHLVFFLLINIYFAFPGNSNLVYTIIRKRQVFHQLANLPVDEASLSKGKSKRKSRSSISSVHSSTSTSTNSHVPSGIGADIPVHEVAVSSNEIQPENNQSGGVLSATLASTPALHELTIDASGQEHEVDDDEDLNTMTSQMQNDRQPQSDSARVLEGESSGTESGVDNVNSHNNVANKPSDAATRPKRPSDAKAPSGEWVCTPEWVRSWKSKLPLQTIMRMLQVLVPQVEKICIDKNLTDESEILKFLQHGTLVGLLPVPHPILIRKYQANAGTTTWFRTYMWGVIYLRNVDPPVWYDTDVKLFEIQRI